jgi:hypothetical protein
VGWHKSVELVEVAPVHRQHCSTEGRSIGKLVGIGDALIGPAGLVSRQHITAKPPKLRDDFHVHVLVAE